MSEEIDVNATTSHEQDGRVLSGVGVTVDRLAETMERHAPPDPAPPADPAAATDPPVDPAAPVSRGRQRFADLTRERDEAKLAREAAERERDDLKARLAQPAAAQIPPTREPVREPEKPAEVKPTRPEPTEEEVGTKYPTYAAFVRDLTQWVFEQERAASTTTADQRLREALAQERQQDQFRASVQASQDRGRKAYPDFQQLLDSPAGLIPLGRTREESIERVAFLANHPQSEHLQYAILKDAALAERLKASDPYTFGVTIAGLVPAAEKPKPAWTPPPPPAPAVGAASPTTAKSSAELIKGHDFDSSGYREKRAAERGVKTRRW